MCQYFTPMQKRKMLFKIFYYWQFFVKLFCSDTKKLRPHNPARRTTMHIKNKCYMLCILLFTELVLTAPIAIFISKATQRTVSRTVFLLNTIEFNESNDTFNGLRIARRLDIIGLYTAKWYPVAHKRWLLYLPRALKKFRVKS